MYTAKTYFTIKSLPVIAMASLNVWAGAISVPSDLPTIQQAISWASPGDTVFVGLGTYDENVLVTKPLSLLATSGYEKTIIEDPETSSQWGGQFTCEITLGSAGPGTIRGFTLQGKNDVNGSGIYVQGNGWNIVSCLSIGNQFGIETYYASSVIDQCTFQGELSVGLGAGGVTLVKNCLFKNLETAVIATGTITFYNNIFIGNGQNLQLGRDSHATCQYVLSNNLFLATASLSSQSGFANVALGDIVRNNIVFFIGDYGVCIDPSATNFQNNDIFCNGYQGQQNYCGLSGDEVAGKNGNISIDPSFCDNTGKYFLSSNSPLIGAGAKSSVNRNGAACDCGPYGGPQANELHYAPASFNLKSSDVKNDGTIFLSWEKSFDKDGDPLSYRCRIGDVTTSVSSFYGSIQYEPGNILFDKTISDTLIEGDASMFHISKAGTYYWNVQAIDTMGLFKGSLQVLSFSLTASNITGSGNKNSAKSGGCGSGFGLALIPALGSAAGTLSRKRRKAQCVFIIKRSNIVRLIKGTKRPR
jgi:hypothetical protein